MARRKIDHVKDLPKIKENLVFYLRIRNRVKQSKKKKVRHREEVKRKSIGDKIRFGAGVNSQRSHQIESITIKTLVFITNLKYLHQSVRPKNKLIHH